MPYKDPAKRRAYKRGWYRLNAGKVKLEVRQRKRGLASLLQEYKQGLKCTRCPESAACCLDFHHVDSDKEDNVATMVADGYSWNVILKEIKKCVVVCRNCHAKLHAGIV